MKGIAPMISLAALILTAGCDPAVTVRQGSTLRRPVTGSMLAQPELMVHVEKYRAFVGVISYTPKIRVSNYVGLADFRKQRHGGYSMGQFCKCAEATEFLSPGCSARFN